MSRAGKSTGKYKNCYNFKNDLDGNIDWINVDNLSDINVLTDDVENVVMFNSVDVCNAKDTELDNWRNNDVFNEVEDMGQHTLSLRWVITEKVRDGKTITKARLVVRGYEEDTYGLRKDSPTCSREGIRIAIAFFC